MTELILSAALFLAMEIFLYLYLDSPRRGSLFWKACATLMPGLWHCGKCGTAKQFRLPEQFTKMGMPEIVGCCLLP